MWVADRLGKMSLREQVAQMIFVRLPDYSGGFEPEAFSGFRSNIIDFGAGGVLVRRNDPLHQAALLSDLQDLSAVPLLVAQDMQRGAGTQVSFATEFPGPLALAASGIDSLAEKAGKITAREADVLGVHLVLGPAVQADSRSPDAIGGDQVNKGDARIAIRIADRFVRGIRNQGVMAATREVEFPWVSSSDSLAAKTSSGRYDFDGLILSDAIASFDGGAVPLDSLILENIRQGVDAFLGPPDPALVRDTVLRLISSGLIEESHVSAIVERILVAKTRAGLIKRPNISVNSVRSVLTDPEHRYLARYIARKSIVALRDGGYVSELTGGDKIMLVVLTDEYTDSSGAFQSFINEYHDTIYVKQSITTSNWQTKQSEMMKDVARIDRILFADLTSETRSVPDVTSAIMGVLLEAEAPVLYAGMGSAENAAHLPDGVNTILLSFGSSTPSIRAMVDAIFGRADVCAELPVALSVRYPAGSGYCIRQRFPRIGTAGEVGLDAGRLRELERLLNSAIADSAFPGAAIAVGRKGVLALLDGFGRFTYESGPSVSPKTIYDLASLTKVIATTTAIMQLYESQAIDLNDPVAKYLPEFSQNNKSGVTIRDLLTHTGGLIPFRPFYESEESSRSDVIAQILSDSLYYEPGSQSRYSDFGPIVLALIVEQLSGMSFDEYAQKRIFAPLEMRDTGYREASPVPDETVAPTEIDDYFRYRLVQGSVHDETAYILGGTAGHAGLFSTVEDLSKFAFMILSDGRIGDRTFLKPETLRLFTSAVDTDYTHTRALGWDTKSQAGYSSAGRYFGRLAFGHTGFTGTSIWFDRDQSLYLILLTNRVYPSRDNLGHRSVRPAVADVVFRAIRSSPDKAYFGKGQ
ncbi:MAG: glycoside hydrolase family 3 N-terminal domain-containing protein [Rhodothermia bacterium]|nr:MAG: glycoside hydrolase family 3 N-terminal domain-containing protein [Rhodothermia bacterium]